MARERLPSPTWLVLFALAASAACERPGADNASGTVASTRGYVLISIDTLRADHLGLYGYQRPTSPFLDSLAARATVFEHAIVQLPGTLPSHMSIFTGLYPAEHGVYPPDGVLAAETPTLPEVFQRNGFRTAGFTEGGYVAGRYGFARGFDEFSDEVAKRSDDIETTFARGVRFLESIRPGERFFLFLHTYAVHDPYAPPERYRRLFATDPPPGTFEPTGPNFTKFNQGHGTISPEAVEYYKALYDAEIRYTDDILRGFFAELARLGVAEQSTVVITADHGEEFLEHGKMVHEQVYHEVLHVPLLIVHPDPATRARVDAVVQSIDLAPTLYELARITAPQRMSGASLLPYLAGRRDPLRSEAYAEAFLSRDRSIHRSSGNELYHLIVRRPQAEAGAAWVGRSISFDWPQETDAVAVRAFHESRLLRVSVDDVPFTELTIEPTRWTPLPVAGVPANRLSRIRLDADGCRAPASVSDSRDDRCLAFEIRGTTAERRELYDVRRDRAESRDLSREHRELASEMAKTLESHSVQPATAARQDLEPALRERLRALGYLP